MIISFINGGLGNQMFQYALGRSLSLKLNEPFKMYFLTEMIGPVPRRYELHFFNIDIPIATKEETDKLKEPFAGTLFGRIHRSIEWRLPYYKRRMVDEKHYQFDPNIFKVSKNCFLNGYWQSEKYFADIKEQIRKDFTFKEPLKGKNLELAEKMGRLESVSLHVRRGDYVFAKATNELSGLATPEYYQKAISHIRAHVKKPVFFIFSDEIDWCREHMRFEEETHYIDHNTGMESYRDMQLMSLCRHNIIANSSFSWWGAWLNNHPQRVIIAPKQWFKAGTLDESDLIPAGWLRM